MQVSHSKSPPVSRKPSQSHLIASDAGHLRCLPFDKLMHGLYVSRLHFSVSHFTTPQIINVISLMVILLPSRSYWALFLQKSIKILSLVGTSWMRQT